MQTERSTGPQSLRERTALLRRSGYRASTHEPSNGVSHRFIPREEPVRRVAARIGPHCLPAPSTREAVMVSYGQSDLAPASRSCSKSLGIEDLSPQAPGSCRTEDAVVGVHDHVARAFATTSQPHGTWLNPRPGPPTDANGTSIPMAQWNRARWPERVHPPKRGEQSSKASMTSHRCRVSCSQSPRSASTPIGLTRCLRG